jgi:two-component system nitrate/nitrite sensor histidine kinase NarX
VAAGPERVRLVVEDDGRGIDDARRAERRAEGHVGLVLLAELATHLDGELTVGPRPGGGTRLELEAPT